MHDPTKLWQIISCFALKGDRVSIAPCGSGHINDTYCVVMREDDELCRYILQHMNDAIFTNPKELMENVVRVTTFLREKILDQGGDPDRETLTVIPTKDGGTYIHDIATGPWRMYRFIEDASSFDKVVNPEVFYQSALAFGHFQRMLADFPAATLHETIADFHNTPVRLEHFKKALAVDLCGRASQVQEEIRFVLDREADTHILMDMLAKGELPLRVTHNDTKLNNIMIDNTTGKGICVIDLDTVMPGLSLNDYGDSIRFGASTAAEDELDLDKVSCDLSLFELFTKGYLEGCDGSLTENEIRMLPMGAKMMTLESGIRFLTDYLQGDTYFKTHWEGQNLARCRTQLKLVIDMEDKWEQMTAIVTKCIREK